MVLADSPNELPVPFHGQGQYSHQVGMALTPGITPSNSGLIGIYIYIPHVLSFSFLTETLICCGVVTYTILGLIFHSV